MDPLKKGNGSSYRFAPTLPTGGGQAFGHDSVAALTVAAVSIPQGMAYALVAGVPIEMGLLAAALPALVAALFGSSPFLVTGPTNPTALVVGSAVVAPAVAAGAGVPIADVLCIGLLSGLLLMAFAVFGFGRASRFLSDSVIRGLTVAVGILVAVGQVATATGVDLRPDDTSPLVPKIWPLLTSAWESVVRADLRTALLVLGVPAAVVALRLVDLRLPGALFALAGASALAAWLGWTHGLEALPTLDSPGAVFPALGFPWVDDPASLGAPVLAIALLVTAQSLGASRSMGSLGPLGVRSLAVGPSGVGSKGESRSERLDFDRELFAQGVANVTASVTGAMPTSGSFTRSGLARRAGARTRAAAGLSGLFVLAMLPLLGTLLAYVPIAALAGLVILTGLDLINLRALRRASVTRGDASVLVVTIGMALWLGIVEAIYAGLFLSLALLVRRTGRLQMVEIVRAGGRLVREIPIDEVTGTTPAVVLHLEGDLNFAVAPALQDQLLDVGQRNPRVLILRLKRARHLDATVIEGLRRVFVELQESGTTVILCGLTDEAATRLASTDLGRLLGADGLLRTGPRLFEGLERAFARAKEMLDPLSEDEIFRGDRADVWSYEI